MNHRHLVCLPAAVAAAVLVGGCGTVASSPRAAAPLRPSATIAAATPTPAPVNVRPSPVVTEPGGAASAISATVLPPDGVRLLPAYVPSGMSAVVRAYPDYYTVDYSDDLHTRNVYLGVNSRPNPPLISGSSPSSTFIQFRGVRTSYVVYDTAAPPSRIPPTTRGSGPALRSRGGIRLSQRYLWWPQLKGIATGPAGIDYYLEADGLTEAEFFRVADSLQAV